MKSDVIKVAYVIGGLPFGGVENWLLDLSLRLRAVQEIEPYVINVSGTGELMARYEELGVKVICIGNGKGSINTHRIDTVFRLWSVLITLQVDIVHTLHFSGDYFGRLAALGLGVPVVTHIRNVKSERSARRRFFNKILSWQTTRYLSVSKAAAQTIQREHNWAGRPVEVLYNAVNPEKLDVPPIDLTERYGLTGRVLIGVGRLVEQKNFDKLIQAVVMLRDQVSDLSLIILGDGPMMAHLQGMLDSLGAREFVKLAGFVPNADVPRYLRAAYALVMPSEYEGLPVTHVEALFCGLPAVISEHVPSVEIAAESSLVCTTEVEDIVRAIGELLRDHALYDSMSSKALQLAPEFSMDLYLEKLAVIYHDLLQ